MTYRDLDKRRETKRRWREANLEKVRLAERNSARKRSTKRAAAVRKWRAENPERNAQAKLRWYLANPQKRAAAAHRWYLVHTEFAKEKNRLWDIRNPGRRRERDRRRKALKRGLLGSVSPNIIKKLFVKQGGLCNNICCNVDLVFEIRTYHLDHILPLALGGLHDDSNLQLLCAKCNLRKGAKHPSDFIV